MPHRGRPHAEGDLSPELDGHRRRRSRPRRSWCLPSYVGIHPRPASTTSWPPTVRHRRRCRSSSPDSCSSRSLSSSGDASTGCPPDLVPSVVPAPTRQRRAPVDAEHRALTGQARALTALERVLTPEERDRITIVIPTKDEARNLPWVLERVTRFGGEILVVDGHSQDADRGGRRSSRRAGRPGRRERQGRCVADRGPRSLAGHRRVHRRWTDRTTLPGPPRWSAPILADRRISSSAPGCAAAATSCTRRSRSSSGCLAASSSR